MSSDNITGDDHHSVCNVLIGYVPNKSKEKQSSLSSGDSLEKELNKYFSG